ncbi:hypothetical protein D3C72_1894830 [compost metagenome]
MEGPPLCGRGFQHEDAGALTGFDQTVGSQRSDSLAHHRAADAEFLRHLRFGGQAVARLVTALGDLAAEFLGNLHHKRSALWSARFGGCRFCHLGRRSKKCRLRAPVLDTSFAARLAIPSLAPGMFHAASQLSLKIGLSTNTPP